MDIKGYRQLSDAELLTINSIKTFGDLRVKALIEEIQASGQADPRWVAIATTHFQQGLMALTRAVAKPEHF